MSLILPATGGTSMTNLVGMNEDKARWINLFWCPWEVATSKELHRQRKSLSPAHQVNC